MFVITKEWFDSNRDFISGLNRAQAEAIGETYPLKKGWKERVLGKVITLEQKKAYEDAKGLVYAVRKKKVKTSREMKSLLLQKEALELELEIAKMKLDLQNLKEKLKEN